MTIHLQGVTAEGTVFRVMSGGHANQGTTGNVTAVALAPPYQMLCVAFL